MYKDVNRYETKAKYQRNMLLGQLVPIILISLILTGYWIHNIFFPTQEDPPVQTYTNIKVVDPKAYTNSQKPTKRNIGRAPQIKTEGFHGQLLKSGQLKILSDNPTIPEPIILVNPKVYTLDDTTTLINNNFSISDLDTGEFGNYIPEDADYEFAIDNISTDTTKTLLTRGPELIYRVRPKIPPIAQDMEIGGVVEVLILIDPEGNHANFSVHSPDLNNTSPEFVLDIILKDGNDAKLEFYIDEQKNDLLYVTLKDIPSEFKFAKYFHEVLPQWQFSPAIKDGIPVYSFVYIKYSFCSPKDTDCIEFTLSSS